MSAFTSSRAASRVAAAALAVLVLAGPVRAAAPSKPQKPPHTPRLSEAVRLGWLSSGIVSGRISVTGRRFGTMVSKPADAGSERLAIRVADGDPVVSYELSTPDEQFSIEVAPGSRVLILRVPKGDSRLVRMEFDQPATGGISLAVGPQEHGRLYRARSLWHLLIMEPEVGRQYLAPLLEPLNPDCHLAQAARQIEAALLRAATSGLKPDRRRWAALVGQLGDDRFARREAADRELRSEGRLVTTYLERLDAGQLDAEQYYRVQRIVQALSTADGPDTPEGVAPWLAGDPAIWLAMLSRPKQSTRRLAAQQLEGLLGEPVAFDPTADATTRQRQLDQLRALILGK